MTNNSRMIYATVVLLSLLLATQIEVRIHRVEYLEEASGVKPAAQEPLIKEMGPLGQYLVVWEIWQHRSRMSPEDAGSREVRGKRPWTYSPPVYRVLTPAITKLISFSSYPLKTFALARILSLWGFFVLFFHLSVLWLKPVGAFAGLLIAAAVANGVWFAVPLPMAIQALLMTFCVWLVVRGRLWYGLGIFALAVTNREDALVLTLFAAIMWLYKRKEKKWLIWALASGCIWLAFRALGLYMIGYRPYYCDVWRAGYNLHALRDLFSTGNIYIPIMSFVMMVLVLVPLACWPVKERPIAMRAGLWVLAAYLLANFMIVVLHETYHCLVIMPFMVPAAVWTVFPSVRRYEDAEGANIEQN